LAGLADLWVSLHALPIADLWIGRGQARNSPTLECIELRHAAVPSVFDPPPRFMPIRGFGRCSTLWKQSMSQKAVLVDAERTADAVYTTVARLLADLA
jgi:hypothetical protein